MRKRVAIAALTLVVVSACVLQPGKSPEEHDSRSSFSASLFELTYDGCWKNMYALASGESIYYATYGSYTSDNEALYDLIGFTPLCPWSQTEYDVCSPKPDSYYIACTATLSHGSITEDSTFNPPWEPEKVCRGNMRAIATAESMYYAEYDCYAEGDAIFEYLGREYYCPTCNFLYLVEGNQDHYRIRCPTPTHPTHGSIVDGVFSW